MGDIRAGRRCIEGRKQLMPLAGEETPPELDIDDIEEIKRQCLQPLSVLLDARTHDLALQRDVSTKGPQPGLEVVLGRSLQVEVLVVAASSDLVVPAAHAKPVVHQKHRHAAAIHLEGDLVRHGAQLGLLNNGAENVLHTLLVGARHKAGELRQIAWGQWGPTCTADGTAADLRHNLVLAHAQERGHIGAILVLAGRQEARKGHRKALAQLPAELGSLQTEPLAVPGDLLVARLPKELKGRDCREERVNLEIHTLLPHTKLVDLCNHLPAIDQDELNAVRALNRLLAVHPPHRGELTSLGIHFECWRGGGRCSGSTRECALEVAVRSGK
eukprot:m.65274 g.65274  ORF g.65274 m.65274 type:complete len:329 (+) comp7314_c0_seq4:333-1319(+)